MIIICKDCGYRQKIQIYSREEAEQRNIRLVAPRCAKCGSTDVELRE